MIFLEMIINRRNQRSLNIILDSEIEGFGFGRHIRIFKSKPEPRGKLPLGSVVVVNFKGIIWTRHSAIRPPSNTYKLLFH